MLYGWIQSNNTAYSSDAIIFNQIEQKHLLNIWVDRQKNKNSNFEGTNFDWSQN